MRKYRYYVVVCNVAQRHRTYKKEPIACFLNHRKVDKEGGKMKSFCAAIR